MQNPLDLFMQMYEGNMIAWLAFGALIGLIACVVFLIILWWKMPSPAKKLFLNNLMGGNPMMAIAYDDQTLRFATPKVVSGEGVAYDKHSGWLFFPRLTKDADELLTTRESRELITKSFRIEGAQGAFYLVYAGKGTIINPELEAFVENIQRFEKKENPVPPIDYMRVPKTIVSNTLQILKDKRVNPSELQTFVDNNILSPSKYASNETVHVPKQQLIQALTNMKDKEILIEPVYIGHILNPRAIKEFLPKAFTKSQLLAQEQKIKDWMRRMLGGESGKIVTVMLFIILIVGILNLVKGFNLF